MAAITATNVPAGRVILSDGQEIRLFTATTLGSGDTVDLSAIFENIYGVKSWKVADGTDAEAFVTSGDYSTGLTLTQNKGAVYIEVRGTSVRSTGGST